MIIIKSNTNIKKHPSYKYAEDVVNGKIIANEHIKIVCKRFISEINDPECEYYFDLNQLKIVSTLLKYINMASGSQKGKNVHDTLLGFQWFFIVNIFCWKLKDNHAIRRYQTGTLLIGRKNSKTFLSAIIFILLLLTEPSFSELYSVAPDKLLSSQIKRQMDAIISSSQPVIRDKFKISQKQTYCTLTKNKYTPLANSNDRLDGREPAAFLSDESGALPNNYPIKAMQSGQITVQSPLGIIISTAYDTLKNPMTEEVAKAIDKRQGENYDPRYFSMLYYPDNPKEWATNEDELLKANPLAQHVNSTKEFIDKLKDDAIKYPAERRNFLTKFMNIFVDGNAGEQFVSETEIKKCSLHEGYDWYGKDVMVGVDFAQSRDNFGISMVTFDEDRNSYIAKSWALYPSERETEKSKMEKVDYKEFAKKGWVIPSGGPTIDYGEAERLVLELEDKFGVNILQIGYDKWEAKSSVAKFDSEGYECVEISQNTQSLYGPTKFLREKIQNGLFFFDENDFYVQNFLNCKMEVNTNMAYRLSKNKSSAKGKIDMVAATVDAMALWLQKKIEEVESKNINVTVL